MRRQYYPLYQSFLRRTFADVKNPYKVLNIKRTQNDKNIRNAYLGLTKIYHPDINPALSVIPTIIRYNNRKAIKILLKPIEYLQTLKKKQKLMLYWQKKKTSKKAKIH